LGDIHRRREEASGTGTATFFALIVIGGKRLKAVGTVSASATGDFVTPEDPYTMELAGAGNISFRASSMAPLAGAGNISFRASSMAPLEDRSVIASDLPWSLLPWSLAGWPQALKSELLSLLDVEGAEEEPSGTLERGDQGV